MSILEKLARVSALKPARKRPGSPGGISPRAIQVNDDPPRGFSTDIPPGAERLAQIIGASVAGNHFGEHLCLRRWFSEPIGAEPSLGAPDEINPAGLQLIAPGATKDAEDPRQWLFLDTETTGLSGGTGTYPFMIGIA